MSRICPVRSRETAARNAPSPTTTCPRGRPAASASSSSSSTPTTRSRRGADRAAAHDALRVGGGGPVERRGGRRAPVDDDRLLVVGAQAAPADVVDGAVGQVEPAEHQALAGQVELGPAVGRRLRRARRARTPPAASRRSAARDSACQRSASRAQHLEPGERAVEDGLLARDLARPARRRRRPAAAVVSGCTATVCRSRPAGGRSARRAARRASPVASTATQRGHRWTSRETKKLPSPSHRLQAGRVRGPAGAPPRRPRGQLGADLLEVGRAPRPGGPGGGRLLPRRRCSRCASSAACGRDRSRAQRAQHLEHVLGVALGAALRGLGAEPVAELARAPAGGDERVDHVGDLVGVEGPHEQARAGAEDVGEVRRGRAHEVIAARGTDRSPARHGGPARLHVRSRP